MTNVTDLKLSPDDVRDIKPAYQRPVLIELDAHETAGGIITGPIIENSTYYIS